VLTCGHDRVLERQPAAIGKQDEDPPDEAVLGALVAVAGEAREVAFLLTAGIDRDRGLSAVGKTVAA
jgi:hypothetical protein